MNPQLQQTLAELETLADSLRGQLAGADKCSDALMTWFEDGRKMRQDIDALATTFQHTLERWAEVQDALLARIERDGDDPADFWKDA